MTNSDRPLVLAVDDDPSCLELFEAVLTEEGCRVLTARTMAAAIALLEAVRPQLVIADAWLPDTPAFALVRWLAHTPHTRALPVLICTAATGDLATLEPADTSPVTVILEKPFDLGVFLDHVRALLQQDLESIPA